MKPIRLDREQTKEIERRRHEAHDRRIYERLSAVLWVAAGKARVEVADLLGCSVGQLAEWLRLFRNRGLDADYQPLLRGRLSSAVGTGVGLHMLAAGGAALPGRHGQRPQAAKHPGGTLPARTRVTGSAVDAG